MTPATELVWRKISSFKTFTFKDIKEVCDLMSEEELGQVVQVEIPNFGLYNIEHWDSAPDGGIWFVNQNN